MIVIMDTRVAKEWVFHAKKNKYIDDETKMKQNPSDYYRLTNVTCSFSDVEKDTSSDEDIEKHKKKLRKEKTLCYILQNF